MPLYRVVITDIKDEPLENYEPNQLVHEFTSSHEPLTPEVYHHALAMLWDNHWTPGSISWRLYALGANREWLELNMRS